ncbi:ferredoxin [Nocardioides sp.]|uniref:ferredoxin n=1 Tax=Nocardioides sp. TaxID=35761 RepID=UPI0035152ABF
MTAPTTATRLRVDWPSCDAHGLCHELLPDLIGLDDWGFPILPEHVPADRVLEARAAAKACPKLALRLLQP